MTDPNKYPQGWDRGHVQAIVDHYDKQAPEEEEEELEASWVRPGSSMVEAPTELMPAIRKLLADFERARTA